MKFQIILFTFAGCAVFNKASDVPIVGAVTVTPSTKETTSPNLITNAPNDTPISLSKDPVPAPSNSVTIAPI